MAVVSTNCVWINKNISSMSMICLIWFVSHFNTKYSDMSSQLSHRPTRQTFERQSRSNWSLFWLWSTLTNTSIILNQALPCWLCKSKIIDISLALFMRSTCKLYNKIYICGMFVTHIISLYLDCSSTRPTPFSQFGTIILWICICYNILVWNVKFSILLVLFAKHITKFRY